MADIEELIVIRKLKCVLNILVFSVSIGIYVVNETSTAPDFLMETSTAPDFPKDRGTATSFLKETSPAPYFLKDTSTAPEFLKETSPAPDCPPCQNREVVTNKFSKTIDLSGLCAQYASEQAEKFLEAKTKEYLSGGKKRIDRFIRINIGWDSNDPKRYSQMFIALTEYLKDNGYESQWIHNSGEVKIDLYYSNV